MPGMTLAHIGFAVLIIGIMLSSMLNQEREVRIKPGDAVDIGPYQFFFIDTQGVNGSNYRGIQAAFEVVKNDRHVTNLYPEKRIYTVREMVMTKVDIHPGIFRDLYIALGEPLDDNFWSVRLYYKPFVRWIWFGGMIMIIGGLLTLFRTRSCYEDKMKNKKIAIILPFVILFALCGIFWRELFYSTPGELPSALVGEEVPDFALPNLFEPLKSFTPKDFAGHVALINVWATWCYACAVEQPMLMKIKKQYHVPIYSIDYKDNPKDAKEFLERNGNPYVMTGCDLKGDTAIDFGVYGTPETFVIDPSGKIIYRYIGAISEKGWEETLYPLIKKYMD